MYIEIVEFRGLNFETRILIEMYNLLTSRIRFKVISSGIFTGLNNVILLKNRLPALMERESLDVHFLIVYALCEM